MEIISLASLTAGMTLDDAKRERDEAAAYLSPMQPGGLNEMALKAARGYLALCELKIEFIEEQLA